MMLNLDRTMLSFFAAFVLCLSQEAFAVTEETAPIRVACLGDSITAGARVDAKTESYPARLRELLDLLGFGVNS